MEYLECLGCQGTEHFGEAVGEMEMLRINNMVDEKMVQMFEHTRAWSDSAFTFSGAQFTLATKTKLATKTAKTYFLDENIFPLVALELFLYFQWNEFSAINCLNENWYLWNI